MGTAAAAVKEFKSEVPSDWGVGAWPRASVVAGAASPASLFGGQRRMMLR